MKGAGWKGGAARLAGAASRRAGKGGTSLPGKVLLRLDPHAIASLSRGLERSAVISATNGKTTTAAMVAAILERGGAHLVSNRAGANMAGGVAGALLHGEGETGLFEVDEFWLGPIVRDLAPSALLLANLFRDQLDRYGELEAIADRWAAVIAAGAARRLVLNADDPLVADLGRGREDVTFFGVEDRGMASGGLQHASDSTHCRRCGAPYTYDAVFLGHLGHYHCPNGDSVRPAPTVIARAVTLQGVRGARFLLETPVGSAEIALPLPGLYNVYNALAAAALALELGAPLSGVVAGLEDVAPAFGRAETVTLAGHELSIMLVKNPAGANEVLRTLALEEGEHDLLAILNDQIADGRDVSWIWDADFETLAPRVRRAVCAGSRAPEMALRLKYAGVPVEAIVVEAALPVALDRAVREAPEGGRLFALPTYTAMLALREELVRRGVAGELVRMSLAVRWHDLECGGYDVDLPLWRQIAEEAGGPVLDVGAGTGRVALDLARRGVTVTALDADPLLLGALSARAAKAGLAVETVCADARELALDARFSAIIVPMQTIQLFGGPEARLGFLARVREQLAPRGLFAAALADAMDGYDEGHVDPPLPDMIEAGGVVYSSRPVAVRPVDGGLAIERLREVVDARGKRTVSEDRIVLDALGPDTLGAELITAGLTPLPGRAVPATDEYVGSAVVMACA